MRAAVTCLLVAGCFTVGVTVEPMLAYTPVQARHDRAPVEAILGEGRRLFAGHFFVKADAYFHGGSYPSIFEKRDAFDAAHAGEGLAMAAEQKEASAALPSGEDRDEHGHEGHEHAHEGHDNSQESHVHDPATCTHDHSHDHAHDPATCNHDHSHDQAEAGSRAGAPRDWIERFGLSFFPSEHRHLGEGPGSDPLQARELLPWLRLSAELDPNRIETYTVAAYWLRTRLNKPREAEEFLRDGLRANPGSYAILFELGRVYAESYREPVRARNVWEAALSRWRTQEGSKPEPDTTFLNQLLWQLALVEKAQGRLPQATAYLEEIKRHSPHPEQVQARLEEWRQAAP